MPPKQQITMLFLRRAILARRFTNPITQQLPYAALERTAKLDRYHLEQGNSISPLHLLPMNPDDIIGSKGLMLEAPSIAWDDRLVADSTQIIEILLDSGAIVHGLTTQPQRVDHGEWPSNFHRTPVNPTDRNLPSGSSSGGKGSSYIVRRSKPLDMYGSLPTPFRLPAGGFMAAMLAARTVIPVVLPLSTSSNEVGQLIDKLSDAKNCMIQPSQARTPLLVEAEVDRMFSGEHRLTFSVTHDGSLPKSRPRDQHTHGIIEDYGPSDVAGVGDANRAQWCSCVEDCLTQSKSEKPTPLPSRSKPSGEATKKPSAADKRRCGVDRDTLREFYGTLYENEKIIRVPTGSRVATRDESAVYWDCPSESELSAESEKDSSDAAVREWTEKRDEFRKAYGSLYGDEDVIRTPIGSRYAPRDESAVYWGCQSQCDQVDDPAHEAPGSKIDPRVDATAPKSKGKKDSEL